MHNPSRCRAVRAAAKPVVLVIVAGLLAGVGRPIPAHAEPSEALAHVIGDWAAQRQAERIRRLTEHLRKTFRVSDQQAITIVTEAMRHGARHGVHPELILAVIAVESTFRERAVSRAGARGLMQVVPRWHPKEIRAIGGAQALFVAEKNISTGTRILTRYLQRSRGDLRAALLRYNGSLANPRSPYARKVLRMYDKLRQVSGVS